MSFRQRLQYEPKVVLLEVPQTLTSKDVKVRKSSYFDSIENVIHITDFNLATIQNIFTKLHDLDIVDIYTSLEKQYENERYDLIKSALLT